MKGGAAMLREILESKVGPLSNLEFAEIKDLVETDIKVNHTDFGKVTTWDQEVETAVSCFIAIGRGNVA